MGPEGSPWVDPQRIRPGPAQDNGPPDAQHFLGHHLFSAPDPAAASCRKLPGPRPPAGLSSLAPLPCPLACAQHSSPPSLVALRFLEAKCDLPKDRAWSPSSGLPLVEAEPSAVREAKESPTEKIPQRISIQPFSTGEQEVCWRGSKPSRPRASSLMALCLSNSSLKWDG